MFRFTKELDIEIEDIEYTGRTPNEILFFDIETTGFSPETTVLYMIGCIYYQQNRWICSQWFADTKDAQNEVLGAFVQLAKNYKVLICYNGIGFDLPYLRKKCTMHGIGGSLDKVEYLDLYKAIHPALALFRPSDMKQKTIENYVGVVRDDKYSGKDLITIYLQYLDSRSPQLLDLLVRHNRDDLVGMTAILKMLSYPFALSGNFTVNDVGISGYTALDRSTGEEATFFLTLDRPVPRRATCVNNCYYLTLFKDTGTLVTQIYSGELKYFYPNYKDYYYLPKEDTAIHKSVAYYVDTNFRTCAKAATCYSKKTGRFLPQFKEVVRPYFKLDYHDKMSFFELTDDFTDDKDLVKKFVLHAIHRLTN